MLFNFVSMSLFFKLYHYIFGRHCKNRIASYKYLFDLNYLTIFLSMVIIALLHDS